ncbi:aldose epimerase family protein [Dysgonomonas sp. 25]|uniref:aldose epimerase family protein n=1 Tax=Dysgonomonas sp. 25 TaxID=2302933 RepID=UPI0013D35912|nr:aldose epimerase family protein [Dysgonomonas sp. 25]NDV67990.1 galactose mutarotase [Dysgonomonas sp. 25]
MKKTLLFIAAVLLFCSCEEKKDNGIQLLDKKAFEKEIDGKKTDLYTLDSGNGLIVQVTNFGLRVVSIWTPDRDGKYADVAIGYENIDRYIHNEGERFLGPVVGRYANRIAKGKFTLDGTEYTLPLNNNGQTLHGGLKGIDMVVWDVENVTGNSIRFTHTSPDGSDGFPGNLKIVVDYTVTPDNEFKITYKATTDKPTVVNLSNHAFFNLKGESAGTITDHVLMLKASKTTPVDEVLIPSGEIVTVENTPFDFRQPTVIGERIGQENEQLKNGGGYDHNWVLDKTVDGVELIGSLYEPQSGRMMEIYTDQPGIQFYSGNFFDGKVNGKYGKPIAYREALALETQKFPDSPNHENFPSTRLNPGEEYTQTCIYKFMTK